MNDLMWCYRIYIFAMVLMKGYDVSAQHCVPFNNILSCDNETEFIPVSNNSGITAISMENCPKLKLNESDLHSYSTTLIALQIGHVDVPSQRQNISLDIFFSMKLLKIFEFSHSKLTDAEMWKLPGSLQVYYVTDNQYTNLDVSMCPLLAYLDAAENKLQRLPNFSAVPPPLSVLRLDGNPMDELRVEHIIPLCDLHALYIRVPEDAFLSTLEGSCDCFRLRKWGYQINLNGTVFGCYQLSKKETVKCDYNCSHLQDLRRKCGDADDIISGCSSKLSFFSGWKIWLIFGAVSLIILGIAFGVYRFVKSRKETDDSKEYHEEVKEEIVAEEEE